jgi:hypothetical protein
MFSSTNLLLLLRNILLHSQVMNQHNRQHISNPSGRYTVYQVPADFHQTLQELKTWDHYMMDADILHLMRLMYKKPKPDITSANHNCPTNHCHFLPPYSELAHTKLGFPSASPPSPAHNSSPQVQYPKLHLIHHHLFFSLL